MHRVFLLSPASSSGLRMQILLRPKAAFPLAQRIREGAATLGEAFEFTSGLYFRGKRAYARHFARPPPSAEGVLVILPGHGLVPEHIPTDIEKLRALREVPVDPGDVRFRRPLLEAARKLPAEAEIVLLGSVASNRYVEPLLGVLGARLLFPPSFVGRGDLSRGGLLLRCVRSGEELPYAPVLGANRRGPRPARLAPLRRSGNGQ
jgi:hypothetical protein